MSWTWPNLAGPFAAGPSGARAAILPRSVASLGEIFCFVAPAMQFLQIQTVGTLLATDLLLLAALPVALLRHADRLRQKPVPSILLLGTLWLLAQVAADLARRSAPEDYLRGWIKITLVLTSFLVAWTVVCASLRRFVLYGMGAAVGGILTLCVHPSEDMIDSPWKFGLAGPITLLLVACVACIAGRGYLRILLPLVALAAMHSFANTRSLALLCFLTAVFTVAQMLLGRSGRRMGGVRIALLVCLASASTFAFAALYSHYAGQGAFGEYARQKLEAQSGEGGILLGGRSEILASGHAIWDSPFLGHGSWARDAAYAAILEESRAELGYKNFQSGKKDDLIPTHSHLFGAWVEAGLAGGAFWIYVFFCSARSLLKVSGWEPLLPLFAYEGFVLLWDILFSPISPERRFLTPYFFAGLILLRTLGDPRRAMREET